MRVVVIPARLESTRLPRKLLLAETGKPLIVHTCEAAVATGFQVLVATDSPLIQSVVDDHFRRGVRTVLTGDCPSGTDRVFQAAEQMGIGDGEVVVNLQGDEPEIEPWHLGAAAGILETTPAEMTTLATTATPADQQDPDVVKVAAEPDGYVTEFSRGPLPNSMRHIGVYAYQMKFLRWFVSQPQTEREKTERLEQLRALENGRGVYVARVGHPFYGIDTRDDYIAFAERYVEKHGVTV